MRRLLQVFLLIGAGFGLLAVGGRPGEASRPERGERPGESHRLFLRGTLDERAGRFPQALDAFQRAADLDPSSAFLQENLAEASLSAGRADRALAAASRAVAIDTATVRGHILLGRAHLARGDALAAQTAFDRALELDPSSIEALGWAASRRALGGAGGAVALFESFLKQNPDADRVRERLADLQRIQGDTVTAEETLRRSVDADPDNLEARLALAALLDGRGDAPGALEEYEAALDMDPRDAAVWARVGQLRFAAGFTGEAREAFDRAAELAPKDEGISFWSALAAQEDGDWTAAAARMERVARTNSDPGVLLRLATYYERLERPEESVRVLRRLQKSQPKNPDFMVVLALAYEDAGRPRSAIRWLERARALDPNRADVHFRLGVNWDRRGRFDRAVPFLRRAVELDPDHHVALNYLGYSFADRNRDLEEALDLIQRALALDPDSPAYRDSLGWVYFRLERFAEAETILGATVHDADDPEVWSHYGDVLDRLGHRPQAIRAWQEGLLLDPDDTGLLKRLGQDAWPREDTPVAPTTAARTLLKRVEGNFRQLPGLAGAAAVTVREGARDVSGAALFYYRRPGQFRIEALGPFFAPRAVLVAAGGEVRWSPEGASGPEVGPWLAALGRVLSGELMAAFDDPAVRVRRDGAVLVYSGEEGELRINGKTRTLVGVRMPGPDGGGLRLEITETRDHEGVRVPVRLTGSSEDGGFSFSIRFSRVVVRGDLAPALFESPGP